MLPLMCQGGPAGPTTLAAVEELPVSAGFKGAMSAQPEAVLNVQIDFSTELENADELLAETEQAVYSSALAAPLEPLQEPDEITSVEPEQDVEQWLLSMLGQRETQVLARDKQPVNCVGKSPVPDDSVAEFGMREPLNLVANNVTGQAPAYEPGAKVMITASSAVESGAASPRVPLFVVDEATAESLSTSHGSALDRAVSQASSSAEPVKASTTTQTTPSTSPEGTLKLRGSEHKWGEQMLHALRENVEMQVQQRMQSATIRLDPPELGSMEIFLSHESGRLSVQISAVQADIARLLQSTTDRLRQELVGQNFMHVSVGVSSDGQPGRQHAQQGRVGFFGDEPVVANAIDKCGYQGASKRRSDVLITV